MGVENSDTEISSSKPISPQTLGSNVETCTILSVRCGTCKDFPSDVLQFRFNTNITANFCQKITVRSLISCLEDGKPPFGQDRAYPSENLAPHPHVDGACRGCQFRRASAL